MHSRSRVADGGTLMQGPFHVHQLWTRSGGSETASGTLMCVLWIRTGKSGKGRDTSMCVLWTRVGGSDTFLHARYVPEGRGVSLSHVSSGLGQVEVGSYKGSGTFRCVLWTRVGGG